MRFFRTFGMYKAEAEKAQNVPVFRASITRKKSQKIQQIHNVINLKAEDIYS